MSKNNLKNSTALNNSFHSQLLDVLINNDPEQEKIILQALKNNTSNDNTTQAHWQNIKNGQSALTFPELTKILGALHKQGRDINPSKIIEKGSEQSPFTQKAFYDSVCQHDKDIDLLKEQLHLLREDVKSKRGYLSKAFNIFSSETSLEDIVHDVLSFEKYCWKNGITFSDSTQKLALGKKPKTKWDKVTEFRFLVAAIGGTALGTFGVDVGKEIEILQKIPELFFGAIPYIALPFISLNIFRAFSEKKILDEWKTGAGFLATMVAGFAISLGVTSAMSGLLSPVDLQNLKDFDTAAAHSGGPSAYILHGIVGAIALSSLYKFSKDKLKTTKNKLTNIFNKASVKTGEGLKKAANISDNVFHGFMDYIGLPAIFLSLSSSISAMQWTDFKAYAGFYGTIGVSLATAAAALWGTFYLLRGSRGKSLAPVAKTMSTAFSISSSMATMPVTKQNLKEMGVSAKIRNSVVPLGANFNMMGISLYLGATAACAATMFGYEPTLMDRLTILSLAIGTAFGAPGAPSSSIIMMEPILHQVGLGAAEMKKMFEIILVIDRPSDMAQTALNVGGDMAVAVDQDRRHKLARLAKWKEIRKERQKDIKSPSVLQNI